MTQNFLTSTKIKPNEITVSWWNNCSLTISKQRLDEYLMDKYKLDLLILFETSAKEEIKQWNNYEVFQTAEAYLGEYELLLKVIL